MKLLRGLSFVLLIISSCENPEIVGTPDDHTVRSPFVVNLDTVNHYDVNPISGEEVDTAFQGRKTGAYFQITPDFQSSEELEPPTEYDVTIDEPLETNVYEFHNHLSPITSLAETNNKFTPGKNGLAEPVTGIAQPSITQLTLPEPKVAASPRFKDKGSLDSKYLDIPQGLKDSYLRNSMFDIDGNLWIGSYNLGLIKYDGIGFTMIGPDQGLRATTVRGLAQDREGNIWMALQGGGICRYDGAKLTHYGTEEGMLSDKYMALTLDSSGNIWAASDEQGIVKLNPSTNEFTFYTHDCGLPSGSFWSIIADRNDRIWVGSFAHGVYCFDGESFSGILPDSDEVSHRIISLFEDSGGNIWIGTENNGAIMYDGKYLHEFRHSEGCPAKQVWDFHEDRNGDIWMACWGQGLVKYERSGLSGFKTYTTHSGLSNNLILNISPDSYGQLWLTTYGGGLNIFNETGFQNYTREQNLNSDIIFNVQPMPDSSVWIATYHGGIVKYKDEQFIQYDAPSTEHFGSIRSLETDHNGDLWMGSLYARLFRFDGKKIFHYTEKQGIGGERILDIKCDSKNQVWLSMPTGIRVMNQYGIRTYSWESGLLTNIVQSIEEDEEGTMWLGGNRGITGIKNDRVIHYTEREGLLSNDVHALHFDNEGNMWIGSAGGLSRFDGQRFYSFTRTHGLPDGKISSVEQDAKGNLWLASGNGLCHVDINHPYSIDEPRFTTYSADDALKGTDFFSGGLRIDSAGTLWGSTGKAAIAMNLEGFENNQTAPIVSLTHLNVLEQYVDYKAEDLTLEAEFDSVIPYTNYPLNPVFPYNENHLTFHFAGKDWCAPHKIVYSYAMEGLDTSWSIPSSEPKADYRNLPYGKYQFKVMAKGEAQVWSEPVTYSFEIRPPWWHTWWARLGYVLFFVGTLVFMVERRTAKLRARQKELQHEINLATEEIRQQKDEVEKQKEVIEEAHKEITDSINYAERIQRSFLATEDLLSENLKDYFVFFQPKEAVSGDFYWAGKLDNGDFAVVNADSTGHGVPGAIMSILNISAIERAVEKGLTNPPEIFNDTRQTIIERLKKDGSKEGGKDGMDASLIALNQDRTLLSYVAAHNPIWVIRAGEIIDLKAEKMPVGKHDLDKEPFTGGQFVLQKGDVIYTMTDGFQDQFGGPKGKKFKVKPLKELLLANAHLGMFEQKELLHKTFSEWKGKLEQIDDVCIIGVRI